MASVVKAVRSTDVRWLRWQAAAEARGLNRNEWIVRALDEQADLDEALAREVVEHGEVGEGDREVA